MKFKFEYFLFLILMYTIITSVITFIKTSKRQKYLVTLLNNKNIDKFLKEITRDIKLNNRSKYRYQLLVFKTSGLIICGKFNESLKILEEINEEKLNKEVKWSYYYNHITTLFYSEDYEKAEQVLKDNLEFIKSKDKLKLNRYEIEKFFAIKEYYSGNLDKSSFMFINILKHNLNDFTKAMCSYYLGLINKENGDDASSKMYFKKSVEFGKKTFIEIKANKMLENLS